MGIVTKIQVQKNNKSRFNIYMDNGSGEEYAFAVSEDTLIKFHLSKGKELDELQIEEILYGDQIHKATLAAMNFLSYRMRTRKEIEDFLAEKEIESFVRAEVIKKLEEQLLINDEEFARAYVRTQMNTTLKGPEVISRELREKGVSPTIIEEALVEFSFSTQLEHVVKLIEKYSGKYRKDSYKIMLQKLDMTLKRKGYPTTVIQEAFKNVEIEQDTSEEWESLQKAAEKYERKYVKLPPYEYKMKMKGALYRKGFPMELIDRYVEEIEED